MQPVFYLRFSLILLWSCFLLGKCTTVPVRSLPVDPPPGFLVSLESVPMVDIVKGSYNEAIIRVQNLAVKGYRGEVQFVFDIQQNGLTRQRSRTVDLAGGAEALPEMDFSFPLSVTRYSRRPPQELIDLNDPWNGCLAVVSEERVFARKCYEYSKGSLSLTKNDGFVAEGKIVTVVQNEQYISERALQGVWKMLQSNELRGDYAWIFAAGTIVLQENIGPQARLPRDFKGTYKIEGSRVVVNVDGLFLEAVFSFDGKRMIHSASETVLQPREDLNGID